MRRALSVTLASLACTEEGMRFDTVALILDADDAGCHLWCAPRRTDMQPSPPWRRNREEEWAHAGRVGWCRPPAAVPRQAPEAERV